MMVIVARLSQPQKLREILKLDRKPVSSAVLHLCRALEYSLGILDVVRPVSEMVVASQGGRCCVAVSK